MADDRRGAELATGQDGFLASPFLVFRRPRASSTPAVPPTDPSVGARTSRIGGPSAPGVSVTLAVPSGSTNDSSAPPWHGPRVHQGTDRRLVLRWERGMPSRTGSRKAPSMQGAPWRFPVLAWPGQIGRGSSRRRPGSRRCAADPARRAQRWSDRSDGYARSLVANGERAVTRRHPRAPAAAPCSPVRWVCRRPRLPVQDRVDTCPTEPRPGADSPSSLPTPVPLDTSGRTRAFAAHLTGRR